MYTHCIHINTQRNRLMLYVVSLKEWQAGKSVNKQEMMLYSYIYHCWYRSCQAPNCYLYATARISSDFYNCLGQYEYHYFCDQHQWLVRCPVHPYGRILCEVSGCYEVAKKYTRNHYTCLLVGQFHLFCQAHAQRRNCPIHPQYYRTS